MLFRPSALLVGTALLGSLASAHADTLNGTALSDNLIGAAGPSTIAGNGGVDTLLGESPASDGKATSLQLLSASQGGAASNSSNSHPNFSPDGTKVVFCTGATNIFPNDTNGVPDVVVKDLLTGKVTLVSAAANGTQGTDPGATSGTKLYCDAPSFSPDGNKVVFGSVATGLVPNDDNLEHDIFVKNLLNGSIQRVSTSTAGGQGSNDSYEGVFSPDGRFVAFRSYANDLVKGDTNGVADVFMKNLATGQTTRVSVTSGGAQANGISYAPAFSRDGRKIAFPSLASNLVAGDTNNNVDIFIKDVVTGAVARVSTRTGGAQTTTANGHSYSPAFSPDGKKIAFESAADDLVGGDTGSVDIFVKNLQTNVTTRVSTSAAGVGGNGNSQHPVFSPDGIRVGFVSLANNLTGDGNSVRDTFVKNIVSGAITRHSVPLSGTVTALSSYEPSFSPDGMYIAFKSESALTTQDTNSNSDIYLARLAAGQTGNDVLNGGPDRDWLSGGAGADTVIGSFGNDVVLGGPGNDLLDGGPGTDLLVGGPGGDRFRYSRTSDSAGVGADTIVDFSGAQGDRILLNAIDAKSGGTANDAFIWIGSAAFSGVQGQLRYVGGILSGDVNGDRKPDIVIRVRSLGAFNGAYVAK